MNLTFRMLQHTSSEVTVGKITNKFKRNVKDWYLIRKMKKIYKPFRLTVFCETKRNEMK